MQKVPQIPLNQGSFKSNTMVSKGSRVPQGSEFNIAPQIVSILHFNAKIVGNPLC